MADKQPGWPGLPKILDVGSVKFNDFELTPEMEKIQTIGDRLALQFKRMYWRLVEDVVSLFVPARITDPDQIVAHLKDNGVLIARLHGEPGVHVLLVRNGIVGEFRIDTDDTLLPRATFQPNCMYQEMVEKISK